VIDLIDDQLLGSVLRGRPSPRPNASIYTTGYFYVRLCQAVLGSSAVTGVLSAPFASLPGDLRARAMRSLLELPEDIGLLSLRELAPVIGQLRVRYNLNTLGMEVLAAAMSLEADVYLSASSPRLEDALQHEGRSVQVIA